MRAKLFLLALALAIMSAFGMFQVKYTVAGLEKRYRATTDRIAVEDNLIRTRRADLALLTRPQRLARHAQSLDMKPVQGTRIIKAGQISRRITLDLSSEILAITLPAGGSGSLRIKPTKTFRLQALGEKE